MKKMLLMMLFLMILGAANVTSQVRIGGNEVPNEAAVLDLNAADAINNGTKTLALPRVSLASTTDKLGYTALLNGMLVYNTNTSSGAGVYYWDTNKWVKVSDGAFTEVDGVIGNEISDTIANGGLRRSGAGTTASPYKVGIKPNGIVNSMIANGAVSLNKISTSASDSGRFLLSNGSSVVTSALYSTGITSSVVLTAKKPETVTWTNILDTTISIEFAPNAYTDIVANGVRATDMCYRQGVTPFVLVFNMLNRLRVLDLHSRRATQSFHVVCYRPAF